MKLLTYPTSYPQGRGNSLPTTRLLKEVSKASTLWLTFNVSRLTLVVNTLFSLSNVLNVFPIRFIAMQEAEATSKPIHINPFDGVRLVPNIKTIRLSTFRTNSLYCFHRVFLPNYFDTPVLKPAPQRSQAFMSGKSIKLPVLHAGQYSAPSGNVPQSNTPNLSTSLPAKRCPMFFS